MDILSKLKSLEIKSGNRSSYNRLLIIDCEFGYSYVFISINRDMLLFSNNKFDFMSNWNIAKVIKYCINRKWKFGLKLGNKWYDYKPKIKE